MQNNPRATVQHFFGRSKSDSDLREVAFNLVISSKSHILIPRLIR